MAVCSRKFGLAKTHFLAHVGGKKREKIWLGQDLNPRSVDQMWIELTITPLVPFWKISKSIYVKYIVMRQKVSLGLSKFS